MLRGGHSSVVQSTPAFEGPTSQASRWRDKVQYAAARGRRIHPPVNALEGPAQTRTKFTCLSCGLNAWAKPSAQLACVACSNTPMSATA